MTKERQDGYQNQCSVLPLITVTHQNQEWQDKVDNQVTVPKDWILRYSLFEVNCFFTVVTVPNQHVLGEPQVRPKYTKREQELT